MSLVKLLFEFLLVVLPFLFVAKVDIFNQLWLFVILSLRWVLLFLRLKILLFFVIRKLFVLMTESCVPPRVCERVFKYDVLCVIGVLFFAQGHIVLLF